MAISKACWGIDVGQNALKAIRLRQSGGDLEVIGFDVIEHEKILSQPDADEQQLIRSALEQFFARNDVHGDTIVVSVPGQSSFSRFIKLPPVDLRKIPEIVRYEAGQQIPFNLEDVIWDYQTMTMPSGGPSEIEVGIFAMKRDIVQDYINDFTQVRVTPDLVQMAPVALYNYLRYDRHDGAGATLLLDVGTENTSLVIADGYRVWIRNFPLGGNNFTQALVKNFKLTFAKAENLKRHAADSKYAREVFQAMRPVFSDLLTEIQRSIGFYTSLHRESRIERVLGMGSTFRLPGLQKFLGQHLGVDVTIIEQFNSLKGDRIISGSNFKENVVSLGVAYGLALQGLGLGSINTTLLPPEILKEKQIRKKKPVVIAAAAAVVVACGLLAYSAAQHKDALARPADVQDVGRFENEVKVLSGVKSLESAANQNRDKLQDSKRTMVQTQKELELYQDVFRNQSLLYNVVAGIYEATPKPEAFETYDAANDVPPWSSIEGVEIMDIATEVVEVLPSDAVAPAGGAAEAAPEMPGMDLGGPATADNQDKIRVLQVIITGTMPYAAEMRQSPTALLNQRLVGPLSRYNNRENGLVFSQVGIVNLVNEYSKVAGYPYERENPRLAASRSQSQSEATGIIEEGIIIPGGEQRQTTPSTRTRAEPQVAPRTPWRGQDAWFQVRFYVNLDNWKETVSVQAPTDVQGTTGGGGGNGDYQDFEEVPPTIIP